MRNTGMHIKAMLIIVAALAFSVPAKAYYQPQEGRFMQRDPLGVNPAGGKQNPFSARKQYISGMDLYDYVNDRPIILTDPMGQNPIIIVIGGGIVITAEEIASALASAALIACLSDPDCTGEK